MFFYMTIGYLYTAYKKNNLFNLIFFQYLSLGIMMVLFYSFNLGAQQKYFNLREGDCYILFYLFFLYSGSLYITLSKRNYFNAPKFRNVKPAKSILIIFLFIIICYWVKNRSLLLLAISNPRMFYAGSRIGGGFIYYIIIPLSICCYFYLITKLNYLNWKDVLLGVFLTILICLYVYIFGSKALIVTIGILFLTTYNYKIKSKNKNRNIIFFGLIFLIAFILIFMLYSAQQSINNSGNFFVAMAQYSDYLNNFCDLVDNLDGFYYGRIFLEDEFLTYIPRAIWSDKPELFGSLALGLNVPNLVEWTLAKTGAPSFGPIGAAYADFGFVGIIFKLIQQLLFIFIAKSYECRLDKQYNFFNHLMMLSFVGTCIFNITLQTIPFYQLIMIILIYYISCKSNHKRELNEKWKKSC